MGASEKILVAMSGGVDSAVAALLLKRQGADIAGAYMKNWLHEENPIGDCPWESDIADARAVCERLEIPFSVVNLMRDYRERVVDYMVDGYRRGLTPNPDVMCNREVKFGVFRQWALEHGFGAVATGHYARREALGNGTFALLEGADPNKDQSYFLALLDQRQLAGARFPVGHLRKPELRRIAAEAGLPNAAKKDSQGICFIGKVRLADFLRRFLPDKPGPILRASDGKAIGRHCGLHHFTLGQRRGIRVPGNTDNEHYVVTGKRFEDNALLVDFASSGDPSLSVREARVHSLHYNCEPLRERRRLGARVRYRDPRVAIEFEPEAGGTTARVRFMEPQRSLAPGQILALYDGERLLGGGVYF